LQKIQRNFFLDSQGISCIGTQAEKLIEFLNLNFTEEEKIIFVENLKFKKDCPNNFSNDENDVKKNLALIRNFDFQSYYANSLIDLCKLNLSLFEILNKEINENILNKNNTSQKENLSLKNNLLLEIIDLNSIDEYKKGITEMKRNLETLFNLLPQIIIILAFKSAEVKMNSFPIFEVNSKESCSFEKIKLLYKNIAEEFYYNDNQREIEIINIFEIPKIFRTVILLESYAEEKNGNQLFEENEITYNYPYSVINDIIFSVYENKKSKDKIFEIVKNNFYLFQNFFEINKIFTYVIYSF